MDVHLIVSPNPLGTTRATGTQMNSVGGTGSAGIGTPLPGRSVGGPNPGSDAFFSQAVSSLTQLLQTQSQILDEQIAEQTTAANVVQSLRAMHNNRGSEERTGGAGGVGQIGETGTEEEGEGDDDEEEEEEPEGEREGVGIGVERDFQTAADESEPLPRAQLGLVGDAVDEDAVPETAEAAGDSESTDSNGERSVPTPTTPSTGSFWGRLFGSR
jgi:hypothetical protein